MEQSIFEKLINSLKNKKQLWPAVLSLSALGLVLPFYSANAVVFAPLAGYIILFLAQFVLQLLLAVSNIILGIVIAWLTLVVSPTFINVSFTTNEFVTQGWTLTKDLVNVGFIILLAVIGLGTALRIKEYEWQKTLPRLLIIMLLINFTPVICGVIIDAANVLMNYFLNGISGWNAFKDAIDSQIRMISIDITNFSSIGQFFTGTFFLKTIASIGLAWMGILVYALFTLLFLARYVMLWVLVILSPIAFFTYVFKESSVVKKLFPGILHWEEWWDQFLQWSIIGVTMSFFLYLSNNLKGFMDTGALSLGKLPPGASGGGWLDATVPYVVALALLVVGFLTSIKTAPMGAGGITSMTKGATRWAAKKTYVKTVEGLRWANKKGTETAGRTAQSIEAKFRSNKTVESIGKMERVKAASESLGKLQKGITEKTTAFKESKTGVLAGKVVKGVTGLTGTPKEIIDQFSTLHMPWVPTPMQKALGEEKDIKSYQAQFQKGIAKGFIDDVVKIARSNALIVGESAKIGAQKALEATAPERAGKNLDELFGETNAREKRMNLSPTSLKNKDVLFHLLKDLRTFEEIGKRGTKEQIDAIKEGLSENANEISESIKELKEAGVKEKNEEKVEAARAISHTIHMVASNPDFFLLKEKKKKKKKKKKNP
ncbi:MAG: hypothetical protein ABH919_04255 [bacterium]